MGLIFPVFKSLNSYLSKSTMGDVEPFKGPSSAPIMCSDSYRFSTNYGNRSLPSIISYLSLVESST